MEIDLKVPDFKSYDQKLSKNLSEKFLIDSLSKKAKSQLADIHHQDNKIFDSLLKNLSKFQKETKMLREQNETMKVELKIIQVLLQNAQKDVERSKENYKSLNSINKSLLEELKNKLTYYKFNEEDFSEETLKHISLVEERISVGSTHRNNGLLSLDNHN